MVKPMNHFTALIFLATTSKWPSLYKGLYLAIWWFGLAKTMWAWNPAASRGVSVAVSAATALMALQPWPATQLIVIKIIGGGEMRVIDIYGDIIVLRHGYTGNNTLLLATNLSLTSFTVFWWFNWDGNRIATEISGKEEGKNKSVYQLLMVIVINTPN